MVKSYCIKEKQVTDCVPGSERFVQAKNGKLMMKCQCTSSGITKTKFVKSDEQKGGPLWNIFKTRSPDGNPKLKKYLEEKS